MKQKKIEPLPQMTPEARQWANMNKPDILMLGDRVEKLIEAHNARVEEKNEHKSKNRRKRP